MDSKTISAEAASLVEKPENGDRPETKPPEIMDLLAKVDQALKEEKPKKALDLITRAKIHSPWARNALGVCQLRLRNSRAAVDVFRSLVLASGGVLLRNDAPAVFKTNYAAALLAADNIGGCLSVLAELKEDDHPTVGKLKAALQQWKKSLTLWQRINWYMGNHSSGPIMLDFPLGDLE